MLWQPSGNLPADYPTERMPRMNLSSIRPREGRPGSLLLFPRPAKAGTGAVRGTRE